MSYFNHAYRKSFVATKATQAGSGSAKAVTAGVLSVSGVHVSDIKDGNAPYSLGVGVVGFFDEKTHLSVTASDIATGCCPFYLAGASIKLNDKQGPFHGGYQESNKSKIINPKYLRKLWKVEGNVATPAIVELGETQGNTNQGGVLTVNTLVGGHGYTDGAIVAVTGGTGHNATFEVTSIDGKVATTNTLVGGTTYNSATGVATTGGTGTGLTVNTTAAAGPVTVVAVNAGGKDYTVGDVITITGGTGDATFHVATVTDGVVTAVTVVDDGYGYTAGNVLTLADGTGATVTVATVGSIVGSACDTKFYCNETYYLRIDVKGTPALRFASHNLYRTFDASGGCCTDPANPTEVNAAVIYKQWATRIAEDPYMKQFIHAILVIDGQSYAYDAETAVAEGLSATTELFANAPDSGTTSGIILKGAYVDTKFGDCTFQTSDYFGLEPIQILASEVDINGDPCAFTGICVVERCPGIQANGTGEQKVRDLILSESYLQNFVSNDLRIREITQGTRAYEVLDRTSIYGSYYILHSVPRFSNPSGVYDNDQYLLEIIGSTATLNYLESEFDTIAAGGCLSCSGTEDFSVSGCTYAIPQV